MARVIGPGSARRLGLPGRASFEIVSGELGAKAVTLRRVEIPVPVAGAPGRGRHRNGDFEECIYVLSGTGTIHAESGELPVKPGNIVLIPAGEKHMTRNTGTEPLVLLCFFPVPDVTGGTQEFAGF